MLSYCVDPVRLPAMDRGLLTSPSFSPAFGHPLRLFGCLPPQQPAYNPLSCPGDVFFCRRGEAGQLQTGNNYHPGFMRRVDGSQGSYLCGERARQFPWSSPDVILARNTPTSEQKYNKTGKLCYEN